MFDSYLVESTEKVEVLWLNLLRIGQLAWKRNAIHKINNKKKLKSKGFLPLATFHSFIFAENFYLCCFKEIHFFLFGIILRSSLHGLGLCSVIPRISFLWEEKAINKKMTQNVSQWRIVSAECCFVSVKALDCTRDSEEHYPSSHSCLRISHNLATRQYIYEP